MTLLTGAQTSVQPIANPVKNRPIRLNVLNPAGLFHPETFSFVLMLAEAIH